MKKSYLLIGPGLAAIIFISFGAVRLVVKAPVKPLASVADFAGLEKQGSIENLPPQPVATGTFASLNCPGSDYEKFSCYETHYQSIVNGRDIKAAMTDLKTRYQIDSYAKAQCHQLAHVVGRTAVDRYPTVAQAYAQGDSACWSGYYHGVMEALIAKIGRDKLDAQALNGLCRELADARPYSFDHYNCAHGLGHGLMYLNENELFGSLEKCDGLTDTWEQKSCWSGIFMENIIVDNKNHFTKYLKFDDPLYPCDAVADKYRGTCYLMQTSYMLKLNGGDFAKVFKRCGQVEEKYQSVCYQSLGRDASGWTISDPVQTKNHCLRGVDWTEQSNCVIGAVKDFISYHHSDQPAKVFCAGLPAEDLRTICRDTAASYYRAF